MDHGQEAVGGECADEEALPAVAVVDELTADTAMHARRCCAEIVDLQRRPVLAEAVGQHAVGGSRSAQRENVLTESLHGAQRRDTHLSLSRVAQAYLDRDIRLPRVDAQAVDQVWCVSQATAGHPQLGARAQGVGEAGVPGRMLRIVSGSQPAVIDLGGAARAKDRRSAGETHCVGTRGIDSQRHSPGVERLADAG